MSIRKRGFDTRTHPRARISTPRVTAHSRAFQTAPWANRSTDAFMATCKLVPSQIFGSVPMGLPSKIPLQGYAAFPTLRVT